MPHTVADTLRRASKQLESAGSPSPRLDAEVLLGHFLGRSRTWLYTWPETELKPEQLQGFHALLERRTHGEPIAYLTGNREFWSLHLEVSPATLIPRPETELLVERALAHIPLEASWTIADLGTGSGAIALAVAAERPRSRIIAVDRSAAALEVAARNAHRLKLQNISFVAAHWTTAFASTKCELIVSNPPYVRDNDPHLNSGDVKFEPRTALAAGVDGLDDIRDIVQNGRSTLRPGGRLLIEHGFDQGEAVKRLMVELGFAEVLGYFDGQGHDRVTEGCWSGR